MYTDIDVPFSNGFQRRRPVYALVLQVERRAEHKSQEITVLPLSATIGWKFHGGFRFQTGKRLGGLSA